MFARQWAMQSRSKSGNLVIVFLIRLVKGAYIFSLNHIAGTPQG